MKKVALILSGSGVYDGSEIQEAVASLAALEEAACQTQCFAPDKPQMHVINHLTGQEMAETRNCLVEAARIARGKVKPLEELQEKDYDGLFLPGGFGAAKNLCNYAVAGTEMQVDQEVERIIRSFAKAKKPMGMLCIAPILAAKLLGEQGPLLTLGQPGPDVEAAQKLGAQHQNTQHEEVVVDARLKLVTGPCYMLDASPAKIMRGAAKVVQEFARWL